MAYVKHLAIRSSTHISNVVGYNTKESKTNDNLIAGVNCDYKKVKEEFELAKILHDKSDCKIIAHQYIQSFKPGEVNPELANQIGIRLADKIAPGYQALVVTHTDRDHIHNHILINSVNIETGYMYRANKESLEFVRNTSDEILKDYNLSVIKDKSGLTGIDQSTYHLALKGQSWKIKMINSIDEAVSFSNTKEEFIKYMNNLGYEVKWQNENISFKDPNEQLKFIRAKTLAKQFGQEYSKEGIENRLRGIKELESNRDSKDIPRDERDNKQHEQHPNDDIRNAQRDTRRSKTSKRRNEKNEYERYEQWKRNYESYYEKESSSLERTFYKLGKASKIFSSKGKGNNKDEAKEETFKILLFIALLFIKQSKKMLKKSLEDKVYKLKDVNLKKSIGNIDYLELKNMPGENKFIKLNKSEFEKLSNVDIKYSGIVKNNSIIIMVKEDEFKKLLELIGRKYEEQFGNIAYKALKDISEKLEYRIVDMNVVKELQNGNMKFACFKNDDGKFNIAFNNKDIELYNETVKLIRNRNRDISR